MTRVEPAGTVTLVLEAAGRQVALPIEKDGAKLTKNALVIDLQTLALQCRLVGIDVDAYSTGRGYFLMNPICFAIAASSIRVGRSLGNVQFLKR